MESNTFFESIMEGLNEAIEDANNDENILKRETVIAVEEEN